MIAEVRRFNRTVTQRIGALQDTFLSRDRPLGQARLLWEIGVDGSEVRALRERLDLDAGYVSRLLRSLEAGGLVEVGPGGGDRRVRTARLTAAGVAERSMLDRGSDRAAATLLGPLGPRQRARLVTAMVEVERLLTASAVQIGETDPGAPGARACLEAYCRGAGATVRGRLRRRGQQPRRLTCSSPARPGSCCWRPCTASRWAAARSSCTRASRPRSSACGCRRRPEGSVSAVACSASWSGAPPSPARTRCGWRRTGRSPRRSVCTARLDTARCRLQRRGLRAPLVREARRAVAAADGRGADVPGRRLAPVATPSGNLGAQAGTHP